jgi:hypothetical protein
MLNDPQDHVSLELEEQFLAGIMMKILARIRSADRHHDELTVLQQQFIPDRRFEKVSIPVDPPLEVERRRYLHGRIIPAAASLSD